MSYDELPFDYPDMQEDVLVIERTEPKHTHRFRRTVYLRGEVKDTVFECQCGRIRDEARSRRGKQSRNYGNRAELSASRKYGGEKIGAAGGPVDIRGKDFATQMKTHRRLPPIEWTKSFAAMSQENRCRRMLLRFVGKPGVPPKDYFVFEAEDFLSWFGRDD